MSLRYFFANTDEEKSRGIYSEIVKRAIEAPKQRFFIIVPDQFTMQTQKELVELHPHGGILNIDILGFSRLSYRCQEEFMGMEFTLLDDTGKCLILQKVAEDCSQELPVLGKLLQKQGMLQEVKSVISEFMQYGIDAAKLELLLELSKERRALSDKLKDLKILYERFLEYIHGRFYTSEEMITQTARLIGQSKLFQGSVVVLDGFTGFTPVQHDVIAQLMKASKEMIVTLTIRKEETPYALKGPQGLFYLTQKTVYTLEKIARELKLERDRAEDIFYENKSEGGEIDFLREQLFLYSGKTYEDAGQGNQTSKITVFECTNPKEEVRAACYYIHELICREHLAYRDIAMIAGDLEEYAPFVKQELEALGIPFFIDQTRKLAWNPMIKGIKSCLNLYLKSFSYEAVFQYLRSGISNIEEEEIDLLENYCLKMGLRGKYAYEKVFSAGLEQDSDQWVSLNHTRVQFLEEISVLDLNKGEKLKSKEYIYRLYQFMEKLSLQEKLHDYGVFFEQQQDLVRAKEYKQIYKTVMQLLEQIYELLGEEELTPQAFYDILEAGFEELDVGIIPQTVDKVIVGDMVRTRLKSVKALFFLGVNDGNIPKQLSKGGMISDIDREFLKRSSIELAPSPREQMYTQRFYLYMNLSRPKEQLYVSYSAMNSQGSSIRPSYLIDTIKELFPEKKIVYPQRLPMLKRMFSRTQGVEYLAEALREYVTDTLHQGTEEMLTLYGLYEGEEIQRILRDAAFIRYTGTSLSHGVAAALYGKQLQNSISRLETFANCAYRHFLQYGLGLREREEYEFESLDLGNIYHEVLDLFGKQLEADGYTWYDFTEEYARNTVHQLLEQVSVAYVNGILYSSSRLAASIQMIYQVVLKAVVTLQKQIKRGSFKPYAYELSFQTCEDLDSVKISLSEQEKMHLRGRIDRVDVAEDEDNLYIKVIDYKSGEKQLDLAAVYYGTQLQLVVYMNVAMELMGKQADQKQVIPGAMFYYHVSDPVVEGDPENIDVVNQEILKKLIPSGIVNSDERVVQRLDNDFQKKSLYAPLSRDAKGQLKGDVKNHVLTTEEMQILSQYTTRKLGELMHSMLEGNITKQPCTLGDKSACTYCEYKQVCSFEAGTIPGYEVKDLEKISPQTALESMRQSLEQETSSV